MSWTIQLIIALAIFAAGAAGGVKWHAGQDAIAAQAAAEAVKSDQIQQRKFSNKAAGTHAAALATINNQLGNAREQIANLSGRECFDSDTAGVLNTIGAEPGGATTGQPAGAAAAAATGTGLRYSTDRDVAGYIAICRARYGEVTSQLNKILDIEDRRHPP